MRSTINFKKNTVIKVLRMFLISKIQRQTEQHLIQKVVSSNYNYDNILIEETSKKIYLPKNFKKKRKIPGNKLTCIEEEEIEPRKIELIFISLLKFPGFIRYIKFQGLTHEDIRKTACYIKHEFYPKGSYIFRKHDKADRLYGVIKGCVSLRENIFVDLTRKIACENIYNIASLNENHKHASTDENQIIHLKVKNEIDQTEESISLSNFMSEDKGFLSFKKEEPKSEKDILFSFIDNLESEIITVRHGMCFGEWGLMYNIPRTASAYCKEDTDVFYLEKEYFDKVLGLKFFKSDMNKINFILTKFPILRTEYQFRHLLTKIVPAFYEKNQIVYTQFDKANTIYLVYQGECGIAKIPKATSKEDIELKRNKMQFLSSITVGGIAGLECANPNSNYDNCLVVTREFTVLLKINIKFICEKCKDFRAFLKPLYEEQVKINNLAEKKFEKRKSEKINNDLALKNNEYQQKYLEKEITKIRHRIQSAKETRIFNSKNRLKEKKLDYNITKFTKNHQRALSSQKKKIYLGHRASIKANLFQTSVNYLETSQQTKHFSTIASPVQQLAKDKKDFFHSYINSLSTEQNTFRISGISFHTKSRKKKNSSINKYSFTSNNTTNNNIIESRPFDIGEKNSFIIESDVMNTMSNIKKTPKTICYDSGKFQLPLLTDYK